MNTRLPLALELAEPTLLPDPAAELQLCSSTRSTQKSSTFNLLGVQVDVQADLQVDDVIA